MASIEEKQTAKFVLEGNVLPPTQHEVHSEIFLTQKQLSHSNVMINSIGIQQKVHGFLSRSDSKRTATSDGECEKV